MNMKRFLVATGVAVALLLTPALVSTVSAQDDSKIVTAMKSKDYMKMKQAQADALANAEYFKAMATKYSAVTDPTAQVAMRAIDALDPNNKAPTNSNDVRIAETNASVAKHGLWSSAFTGTVKTIAGGVLGYKGLDTLATLGTAAINKPAVSINADNGSTVQGSIGEGNTFEYVEQTAPYSGIAVPDGIPFSEVQLVSVPEVSEELITDEATCLLEGGTFIAEETRCSDNNGGTL